MAVEPYTPDPVAGAATDALGHINRYNDQEPVRATLANFPDEQIIDWVSYIRDTGAGKLIIGNGSPPPGGYTPTSNPIRILGTGIEMQSPMVHSGPNAYTSRPSRLVSISGSPTIDWRLYDYVYMDTATGDVTPTIKSTSPQPLAGVCITFWRGITANVGVLTREDATTICTFPASTHCSATILWVPLDNNWRLVGGFGIDLTGANP